MTSSHPGRFIMLQLIQLIDWFYPFRGGSFFRDRGCKSRSFREEDPAKWRSFAIEREERSLAVGTCLLTLNLFIELELHSVVRDK